MASPNTREQAWQLLCEHTKTESLRKHALCVEGAMRHFAALYNEDVEYWGQVGLLHDLDYEKHPEEHCKHTPDMLRAAGYDEGFIRSVLSHGYGLCTDVLPEKQMEKVIYAADELTGLVTACALMRPSKSVMDLETKSVKKKFKTLNFAASVDRNVIEKGAAMMEVELDWLIEQVILALRAVADDIGFGMQQ